MTAPTKKPAVDYESIEPGWRAGILSPRQLAAAYTERTGIKVSHAAIIKHFKKLDIPRDLNDKIKAKAEAKVTQALVTRSVTEERLVTTEATIVEVNATFMAETLLSHRKDIGKLRALCNSMVEELELQGLAKDELAKMAEVLVLSFTQEGEQPDPAEVNRQYKLLEKLLSLGGRVEILKRLSESMKNLIALERQAIGLKDDELPGEKDPLHKKVRRIELVAAEFTRTTTFEQVTDGAGG
jgi:hypothetical protein